MLGVRDTRRVAWRRRHASQHYVGYVTVTDDCVRLAGTEHHTGIDVALSIPYGAIRKIRLADDPRDDVVGERSVILELREDDSILVRPICVGPLNLDVFARKLRPA